MGGRNLEIEIKARIASIEEMARTITSAGAEFDCDLVHVDYYFDKPAKLGSFARTDEALRLRVSRNETRGVEEAFLTYKGPKVDATTKTREEIDVGVADAGKVRQLLSMIGFKEVIVIKKVRKHYHHGDVSIMLDLVEGLPGPYMEVEIVVADEATLAARREQLFAYLEGVGIGRDASERRSYLELVLLARSGTPAKP
ncbi:MAG: class IV adenylate cyclase [Candidatus Lokiarchaeota archaeon]|nr:class IV adenylate cyclase [Candidatus Lokiarchaeota archaeon]